MAEIKIQEKTKIEKFLEMGSGYVSNFSDRTFREFISETADLDIEDSKYHFASNSKANRFRQFMKVEDDYTVGKVLTEVLNYHLEHLKEQKASSWYNFDNDEFELKVSLHKECLKITERLKGNIVNNINAIRPNTDDIDFKKSFQNQLRIVSKRISLKLH